MRKFIAILITAAITLTIFSITVSADTYSRNTPPLTDSIYISGSPTLYPVMSTIAEAFKNHHPKVTISFSSTGLNNPSNDVNQNRVSFGMISTEWTKNNTVQFPNIIPVQICTDSVAVVVHRSNPIDNITIQQLKSIYGTENRITNWNGVSGENRTITAINREQGSSELDLL